MRGSTVTAPLPRTTGPVAGPTVAALLSSYRDGTATPTQIVDRVLSQIEERGEDGTWISVGDPGQLLDRAAALEADASTHSLPLYGIPFALKDSIDVAGWETTLACPDYAYGATQTAPSVQRLLDAGAILIGKTNLDQFATGLNGTRTPVPHPPQCFRQRPDLRRLELGVGPRGRAGRGPVRRRNRYGRLRTGAGRAERCLRLQAVTRPDQRRRPGAGLPVVGLREPDGGDGSRSADRVRRHRGPGHS